MSPTTLGVIALVVVLISLDFLLIRTLVRAGWDSLSDRFPGQPVAADAVRRNFQSFAFGRTSFGYCVHVAADSAHLHLLPARFLRWFGCGPISIPWGAIAIEKRRPSRITARIAGTSVNGPAWCLSLAEPTGGVTGAAAPGEGGAESTGRRAPPHR